MQLLNVSDILIENSTIKSSWLERDVRIDCYYPRHVTQFSPMNLLLINDGQNMKEMGLETILDNLYAKQQILPLFCAAIHACDQRKMEYGVASKKDYLGQGARAAAYTSFIIEELLPFIRNNYREFSFREQAFAGFSLGGLSALDIVWNHPDQFSKAGVFSGSLWWRSVDQDDEDYDDHAHRIMHQVIRHGTYHAGLKFFFQCGNKDETKDRNNNGIIDSVDDTLDLIKELKEKGYRQPEDIFYLEMPEGRHDIPTWGKAMPEFLKWGWGDPAK